MKAQLALCMKYMPAACMKSLTLTHEGWEFGFAKFQFVEISTQTLGHVWDFRPPLTPPYVRVTAYGGFQSAFEELVKRDIPLCPQPCIIHADMSGLRA